MPLRWVKLKLWPQKRWKQIILVLVIALIVVFVSFAGFAGLLLSGMLNREVVSEIEVVNSDGDQTALIVYQPGFSSFPKDVSHAFAEGLVSSGWRVEITTASSEAPSDLSKYNLLTLAYPVYGGTPGTAIVSYVNRISDFNGIDTVIIACGGGDSGESVEPLKQQVEAANGKFYDSLALSNQVDTALESARQAGSNIAP
jgi:flavorubredoxin